MGEIKKEKTLINCRYFITHLFFDHHEAPHPPRHLPYYLSPGC